MGRWLFVVALVNGGFAQQRVYRQLTVEDGLIQSHVNSLCVDHHGYLWVATLAGLSRWDGFRFQTFQRRDGLPSLAVSTVKPRAEGSVWAATWAGGMAMVGPQGAVPWRLGGLPADGNIWDFVVVAEKVWACATDSGLYWGENLDHLDFAEPRLNACRAVVTRREGSLFVGTLGGLVEVERDGSWRVYGESDGLIQQMVVSLLESADGTLWVGTFGGGAFRFQDGQLSPINAKGRLTDSRVAALFQASDGDVYFGTHKGLTRLHNGELLPLTPQHGLNHQMVHALAELPGGTMLLGTFAGLAFYDPRERASNFVEGLRHPTVNGIVQHPNGSTLLSTYGGGIHILNQAGEWVDTYPFSATQSSTMLCLAVDQEGVIYGGMDGGGFYTFRDGQTQRFSRRDGLRSSNVTSIAVAGSQILFGTYDGVYQFKGDEVERLELPVPAFSVTQIIRLSSDEWLIATDGWGLFKGNRGDWAHHTMETGLPVNAISAVAEWRDQRLVLANAGQGLWLQCETGWDRIAEEQGLQSAFVVSLACSDERIYAGTLRGVAILEHADSAWEISHLTYEQGLAGNECQLGALFLDEVGRLWVGTNRGATVLTVDTREKLATNPPPLNVTSITVGDQIFNVEEAPSQIPAGTGHLSLNYVGIDLEHPQSVRHQYRLNHGEWRDSPRETLTLAQLGDGLYSLQLRSRSQSSAWSEPFEYAFRVLPFWWETWWFVLLVAMLALSLVSLVIWTRMRQALALERIRTRIAADLHDNIGSGLTQIAIISEVLRMRKPDGDTEKGLRSVSETARELVDAMSDIVWLVHPRRDRLHDLVRRLRDSYESLAALSEVRFTAQQLTQNDVRLPMETRHHLYLIFKEAIANSIKHSGCTQLDLSCQVKGKRLEMCLADDGQGFDVAGAFEGNGLTNMKRRAQAFRGHIHIDSQRGSGTVVRIQMAV